MRILGRPSLSSLSPDRHEAGVAGEVLHGPVALADSSGLLPQAGFPAVAAAHSDGLERRLAASSDQPTPWPFTALPAARWDVSCWMAEKSNRSSRSRSPAKRGRHRPRRFGRRSSAPYRSGGPEAPDGRAHPKPGLPAWRSGLAPHLPSAWQAASVFVPERATLPWGPRLAVQES